MMTTKKAIGKMLIIIAFTLVTALAGVGIVSLILSVLLPELISGAYIINLAYGAVQLATLGTFYVLFLVVVIKKDKKFFQ